MNDLKMKLLLILFIFLTTSVFTQIREVNLFLNKRDQDTIEREATKFLKAQKLPGMSLVIANQGKIIFSKSYGYASVSRKINLEPKHKMSINNCTQVFTSMAIMKLLEEGKISLEDTVLGPGSVFEKEFPEVKKYEAMITVRHLLEQTAGTEWSSFSNIRFLTGVNDLAKVKNYLSNVRIYRKPGQKVQNSRFAYYLLGRIIEKKSGKKYLEYLQETLKDHLESDISLLGDSNVKDVALHYDEKMQPDTLGMGKYDLDAKNSIVCSPHDFMNLLLSIDGLPVKKDVLSEQAVKIMHSRSPVSHNDGKGWVFTQEGDIIYNWFRTSSSAAYKMRTDGITWVFIANGRSNRGKAIDSFTLFPDQLIGKLKDIP